MDKDKVLPLVYKAVFSGGGIDEPFDVDTLNRSIGLCEGAARQQLADWERVKKLVEALESWYPGWIELPDPDDFTLEPWEYKAWTLTRKALAQLGEEVKG